MPEPTEYVVWAKQRGVDQVPRKVGPRLTMDEYGLALADVVKLRAACTRRQVGAVIIGPDKRILATGYNGTKPGEQECVDGGCPRGAYTYEEVPPFLGNDGHKVPCIALHAEDNAISYAARVVGNRQGKAGATMDLSDCTLYVSCQPCPPCATKAAAYGLRVLWPQ